MNKILFSAAVISSITLLSSCDTTALEQALNASSNNSSYGNNSSGYGRQQGHYHDDGYNQNRPPHNQYQNNQAQDNRNAFQVGSRLGADDFKRGYQKKYMRHERMYDSNTREKFKSGYYSGYEDARDRYNRTHKNKR